MKNLKIMSALALSLLLFTGCEKEEDISKNDINKNSLNSKSASINEKSGHTMFYVVGSEDNPFNQLGFDHNQILDYMRSIFSSTMSKSDLFQNAVVYAENTLGYNDLESNLSETNVDSMIINYSTPTDFYAEINSLFGEDLLTESEHSYLESMLDIGSNPNCESCTFDEAVNLALIDVENLEDQVLNDNQLSSSETDNILISLAVFKYSMNFWRNEAQRSSTNYSITLIQSGAGTGQDFVESIPWYARDTAGATTTVLTGGGFLFALAGPIGVIGGALVGGAVTSMI